MGSCVCCLAVLGDLAAGWGEPEASLWVLLALSQHWLHPGWLCTALSCDQPPQVRLQRARHLVCREPFSPRAMPYPPPAPEPHLLRSPRWVLFLQRGCPGPPVRAEGQLPPLGASLSVHPCRAPCASPSVSDLMLRRDLGGRAPIGEGRQSLKNSGAE